MKMMNLHAAAADEADGTVFQRAQEQHEPDGVQELEHHEPEGVHLDAEEAPTPTARLAMSPAPLGHEKESRLDTMASPL